MDISLPPSRKQCVSLLLLGSVMAAPGEEARLIHSTVLQPHLRPESLKASMREDLGFKLLRVQGCGFSLKVKEIWRRISKETDRPQPTSHPSPGD